MLVFNREPPKWRVSCWLLFESTPKPFGEKHGEPQGLVSCRPLSTSLKKSTLTTAHTNIRTEPAKRFLQKGGSFPNIVHLAVSGSQACIDAPRFVRCCLLSDMRRPCYQFFLLPLFGVPLRPLPNIDVFISDSPTPTSIALTAHRLKPHTNLEPQNLRRPNLRFLDSALVFALPAPHSGYFFPCPKSQAERW